MTNRFLRFVLIVSIIILLALSVTSIAYFCQTLFERIDLIFTSIVIGIISGFLSNYLFRRYEKANRIKIIHNRLKDYEGKYDVYHWKDLINPDNCNYKISISLDEQNGILKILQAGSEDDHELFGDVKMNESTFTYGEGNYAHPKKQGSPTGRIQLYLVEAGTINVDKYYLDDAGQKPGFEKWQWRKENNR